MEYKKLNAENKTKMKQEINSDLEFEWEDRKLLDILLMQFERLNNYDGDPKDLEEFIRPINSCINDFNRRKIKYTEFVSKMKKMLKKFPSFTVIIKIIFTNIDKFNVFLNLLHFLLVVLSGM